MILSYIFLSLIGFAQISVPPVVAPTPSPLAISNSLFSSGRFKECIEISPRAVEYKAHDDQGLNQAYGNWIKSLVAVGTPLKAVDVCKKSLFVGPTPKRSDFVRTLCIDWINKDVQEADLLDLAKDSELGFLRAFAWFRLAQIQADAKSFDAAIASYENVVAQLPETDLAGRAEQEILSIKNLNRVEPQTIGVVLPLTGRYAGVAQKTLRGIQMGLGLHTQLPSSFKLAVVDSEGNPDSARRGVERLVKEDGVVAIVGSLLTKTASAVAAKASELGVPTIALSQKAGVTDVGPLVFRNALTTEMQVQQLVRTAMDELGLKRFAILFPNDSYGVEFTNHFWDAVLARGGSIAAAQFYDPKETDFREPIQRLVGTYYIEDRAEEYKNRITEWSNAQANKRSRRAPPEDILPPIVDFDAVFIPDNAKAFGQISAMMAFNNIKGVKLLGTNLLNVPDIAKRAGNFADHTIFVDGTPAANSVKTTFIREYKNLFGEEPSSFELQGYDSALILRNLALNGSKSREEMAKSLSSLKDFPAGVGRLKMSPEREVARPLFTFKLEKGEIVPIKN